MRIAVIGAGSWGTALAHTLARGDRHEVTLWTRGADAADAMATTRHNPTDLTELAF
jgi:glycerol-3-phosphate dehydrogenase (NAD(P)+)